MTDTGNPKHLENALQRDPKEVKKPKSGLIWNHAPAKVWGWHARGHGVAGCWQFLKVPELSAQCDGLAAEGTGTSWVLQTLVIHRRHCKIMILIRPAARVWQGLWAAKSCILLFFYSSLGHFIFLCKPHEWLGRKIVFWAAFPTAKDVYYIFMKTLQ